MLRELSCPGRIVLNRLASADTEGDEKSPGPLSFHTAVSRMSRMRKLCSSAKLGTIRLKYKMI